ncbi:hypothetical protein EQ845_00915 [Pseudomonas putida]|nr:hypothetical protein EQ845_00915 [Pseudomonas putida]
MCRPPIRCRSGFTREYGSGSIGERRVEIGQQARPPTGVHHRSDVGAGLPANTVAAATVNGGW